MVSEPTPRILVVSADGLLRELLASLLRQEGLEAVEATDLPSALRASAERQPTLLLVDAIEGADHDRAVLDAVPRILLCDSAPVVALVSSVAAAEVARHPQVDRTLEAPFRTELLVAVIRHHLTRPSRRAMQSGTRSRDGLLIDAAGDTAPAPVASPRAS